MYLNGFKDKDDIAKSFEMSKEEVEAFKDALVLFASYTYEDYNGSALVIYELHGKLYEVHGGHCSCNGLEGQWSPQETSYEAISARYADERAKEYLVDDHGKDALSMIEKILSGHVMEKEVLH